MSQIKLIGESQNSYKVVQPQIKASKLGCFLLKIFFNRDSFDVNLVDSRLNKFIEDCEKLRDELIN